MSFDDLGTRMKEYYEKPYQIFLPRRSNIILRADGKSFYTYTKGCDRPFDMALMSAMDRTAIELCREISGAMFAFVQSDEISVLVRDMKSITTQAWFDNKLQKMCSVSASIATSTFNIIRREEQGITKIANFDSRVFQIPQDDEVINYFIWRQQDTVRNSIASVAQSLYSSKELHGKNSNTQQEMIFAKGINWNDYAPHLKRGRIIYKQDYTSENPMTGDPVQRSEWIIEACPTLTQERWFLNNLIFEREKQDE